MVRAAKQVITTGAISELRAVQSTCWFYKPDYYFEVAPWRTKHGAGPISVNLVHDVEQERVTKIDIADSASADQPYSELCHGSIRSSEVSGR